MKTQGGRGLQMQTELFLSWEKPGKALITGASSGLGTSFAEHLARRGFDLVLLARREDRLKDLARKLESQYSVHCEIISADLSNLAEIESVSDRIRHIENLDVLINCAGFGTIGYFAEIPIEKSMRMFHVHTTAPVEFTHAALRGMLKRKRGAIINVSSTAAFLLMPGNVIYDATKSFLAVFSENLQLEIRDSGIRIQALCPGFTRTEFHEVGDFRGFDRSVIPEHFWMRSDEVVMSSLRALEKNKKVVFIPGLKNRLFTWVVRHSSVILGMMQRQTIKRGWGPNKSGREKS